MKNCMFQYATKNSVYVDTDLISMEEALDHFEKWKGKFKEHLESGLEPEMALWINCRDNSSYGETLHHWHSDEFMVQDGVLWRMV